MPDIIMLVIIAILFILIFYNATGRNYIMTSIIMIIFGLCLGWLVLAYKNVEPNNIRPCEIIVDKSTDRQYFIVNSYKMNDEQIRLFMDVNQKFGKDLAEDEQIIQYDRTGWKYGIYLGFAFHMPNNIYYEIMKKNADATNILMPLKDFVKCGMIAYKKGLETGDKIELTLEEETRIEKTLTDEILKNSKVTYNKEIK